MRAPYFVVALAAATTTPPLDLSAPPPPRAFPTFTSYSNASGAAGEWAGVVAEGALTWPNLPAAAPAAFAVLPALLSPPEVAALLRAVRDEPLDTDADSVDALPTHELYLDRGGAAHDKGAGAGAARRAARRGARAAAAAVAAPAIAARLAPFVNARFAGCAAGGGCVACHSLVRKYADGARLAHPTHFDIHAFATVVVSLGSAGVDFRGGLYVSTGAGSEAFVALQAGDAVVHQSTLLHGVRVDAGERWSWIVWFKPVGDAAKCDSDSGASWAAAGAAAGDPVAAFLHARRARARSDRVSWLRKSAAAGFERARNELGMALLERAPAEGRAALAAAAAAGEPEALYNNATQAVREGGDARAAVRAFAAAAAAGVRPALFNVGVALFKGAGAEKDVAAAARWFAAAGDAKALGLAADIAVSLGWANASALRARAAAATVDGGDDGEL
jgi:hypothetical protein